MIVALDTHGPARLLEPCNFRAFKVQTPVPPAQALSLQERHADMMRMDTAGNAWISLAWLRQQGLTDAPNWEQDLEQMVEKAKPHGWISNDGSAVRAHVEWARPQEG